jgi:insulysin
MWRRCTIFLVGAVFALSICTPAVDEDIVDNIEKPELDDRSYRGFTLDNELKVLVISDPSSDSGTALLQMGAGSLSDPWDMQGLSHFIEHMLFIASEKYPEENGFDEFVTAHGGSLTGITTEEAVRYMFTVQKDFLEEALDRFAQWFICPLFTESAVEREVNAVDSEFSFNKNTSNYRNSQLIRELSKPGHAYRKFLNGNNESLVTIPKQKGLDPVEELIKFYNNTYSANRMNLVVLGTQSVDDLARMVKDKFSAVENKQVQAGHWDQAYGKDQLMRYVKVEQLGDWEALLFYFPIPDTRPLYRCKPQEYLEYLTATTGHNSLDAYLKNQSWSETMTWQCENVAASFGGCALGVHLTETGKREEVEVARAVFQWFNLVRKEAPQKRIFDEIKKINDLHFQHQEKKSTYKEMEHLVDNIRRYPMELVLSANTRVWDFNATEIQKYLNHFVPENVIMLRYSKHAFGDEELNKTEPWCKVKYFDEPISSEMLRAIQTPGENPELKLSEPNAFIAHNSRAKTSDPQNGPYPELVKSSNFIHAWFLQDNELTRAKAMQFIKITFMYGDGSPLQAALGGLFVRLIEDDLYKDLTPAKQSGIWYHFRNGGKSLDISVEGFEHKQYSVIQRILNAIVNLTPDPAKFENLKQYELNNLKTWNYGSGFEKHRRFIEETLIENTWPVETVAEATESITFEQITQYRQRFLTQSHVDYFGVGNLVISDVVKTISLIESTIKSVPGWRPIPTAELHPPRQVLIPPGTNFVYHWKHPIATNNFIHIYLQASSQRLESGVLAELIAVLLEAPAFTQLRATEQLGYAVSVSAEPYNDIYGLTISLQSIRPASFVIERIDNFLDTFRDTLANLTAETLESTKKALITTHFARPTSLMGRAAKYWAEINRRTFLFDREKKERAIVKKLTLQNLTTFYNKNVAPPSPDKLKRVIFYISGNNADAAGHNDTDICTNMRCFNSTVTLQESLEHFPVRVPHNTVEKMTKQCQRCSL